MWPVNGALTRRLRLALGAHARGHRHCGSVRHSRRGLAGRTVVVSGWLRRLRQPRRGRPRRRDRDRVRPQHKCRRGHWAERRPGQVISGSTGHSPVTRPLPRCASTARPLTRSAICSRTARPLIRGQGGRLRPPAPADPSSSEPAVSPGAAGVYGRRRPARRPGSPPRRAARRRRSAGRKGAPALIESQAVAGEQLVGHREASTYRSGDGIHGRRYGGRGRHGRAGGIAGSGVRERKWSVSPVSDVLDEQDVASGDGRVEILDEAHGAPSA